MLKTSFNSHVPTSSCRILFVVSSLQSYLLTATAVYGAKDDPQQTNGSTVLPLALTDSGIDDPSSYMEPTVIRLGESEFQEPINDVSVLEGSVVDTDYVFSMARPSSQRSKPTQSATDSSGRLESVSTPPSSTTGGVQREQSRPKSKQSRLSSVQSEPRREHHRSRTSASPSSSRTVEDKTLSLQLEDSATDSAVRDLSLSLDETRQSHFSGKVTSC